jgi:hypothetical protein
MNQEVYVNHWRYDDGWHNIPSILRKDHNSRDREFIEYIIGWHCWVYCDDHSEFISWMQDHCPTADCTARFNSGNPMITIHIKDKDEAAYFMLSFQVT